MRASASRERDGREPRGAERETPRERELLGATIFLLFPINSTNGDRRVIGLARISTRGNKLITTPRDAGNYDTCFARRGVARDKELQGQQRYKILITKYLRNATMRARTHICT